MVSSNRESDAPRAPPPLSLTVEAYARNITIPAARSRPMIGAHYNHDTSNRKSPTQPGTLPRHHQQELDNPLPHHQGGVRPTSPSKRSTTILPKRPLPTRSSRPQSAPASHSQPQPSVLHGRRRTNRGHLPCAFHHPPLPPAPSTAVTAGSTHVGRCLRRTLPPLYAQRRPPPSRTTTCPVVPPSYPVGAAPDLVALTTTTAQMPVADESSRGVGWGGVGVEVAAPSPSHWRKGKPPYCRLHSGSHG
jgi:hypothetical protein